MKSCSVCATEKPLDAFNWRNKKKGWRRPECRECQSRRDKATRASDPVAHNAAAKERKRKWRASGGGKRWYAKHRDEERARGRERYNDPTYCARKRAWWERNKAKHQAATKRWAQANQDKVKAIQRAHYEANKASYDEKARVRRAVKRAATICSFTLAELDARMSVFGHRCAYCGGPFEEIDHVKPISKGGPHCLANLRPSCVSCNRRKSAKPPRAWLLQTTLS